MAPRDAGADFDVGSLPHAAQRQTSGKHDPGEVAPGFRPAGEPGLEQRWLDLDVAAAGKAAFALPRAPGAAERHMPGGEREEAALGGDGGRGERRVHFREIEERGGAAELDHIAKSTLATVLPPACAREPGRMPLAALAIDPARPCRPRQTYCSASWTLACSFFSGCGMSGFCRPPSGLSL